MKQEDVMCPLCGDADLRVLDLETRLARVPGGRKIVQCAGCGVAFVSPRPTKDELEAMYRRSEQEFRAAGFDYIGGENGVAPYLRRRLEHLERLIGRRGRLLDIGVGSGAFLKYAAATGWNASGSERIPQAAHALRARHQLDVHVGDLSALDWAEGTFDVIHMNHVLEHLVDPAENLRAARRFLKPGGVLAVEVPWEFADVPFMVRRALNLLQPYTVATQHLWFFTPRSLSMLLAAHDFDVVSRELRRDCADPNLVRRLAKHVVHQIERPLARGPLMTLIARRRAAETGAQPDGAGTRIR